MGLPVGLFLFPAPPDLRCPLCRDVLDDPSSLQCGHSFCRACLLSYQENGEGAHGGGGEGGKGNANGGDKRKFSFKGVSIVCPTCRHIAVIDEQEQSSSTSHSDLKGIVENLPMRCRNQLRREEELSENESGSGEKGARDDLALLATRCDWTGKLCEYASHAELDCPLELITCRAANCNERGRRGAMRSLGYCNRPECARTIAGRYLSGRSRELLQSDTRCAQTQEEAVRADNVAAEEMNDKENENSNFAAGIYDGGARAVTARKEGGLMTQRLAQLCLEADRILAKPFSPDHTVKTATPPRSRKQKVVHDDDAMTRRKSQGHDDVTPPWSRKQVHDGDTTTEERKPVHVETATPPRIRKQVHDDDKLVSPRPWATNTPRKKSSATKEDTTKVEENDDATKKEAAAALDTTKDESGNNSAFVVAAVKILVDKEMAKIRRQTAARDSIETLFVHRHITEFCRSWMRRKPDALFDFVVYRPKTGRATRLLCGIPGPRRTRWEGGLFPLLMEWKDADLPPQCRFPPEFHHANVRPSGLVSLSTLKEDWHPEVQISEILFDIQQLLAHPNYKDTAQSEARESYRSRLYGHKTTIQTSLYAPKPFLEAASDIDGVGKASSWQLVDGEALSGRRGASNPPKRPKEPAFSSSRRNACRCSCCAWGRSLWDSEREMRHLFGKGGS